MKKKSLAVLALALTFSSVFAQNQEEQTLNSAPINVDGYLHEDRPVTDGELEQIRSELNKQKTSTKLNKEKVKDLGKLTQQTEKLLESQDEYIDQKVESTHAIKEFNDKYEEGQRKLKCIMEEADTEECAPYKNKYKKNRKESVENEQVQEVSVAQAAPAVSQIDVGAASPQNTAFEEIKVLPFGGASTFVGKKEQLETELSAGLRLESNISSRFAMGVGFNYQQLKTNDFANSMGYMNTGYMGVYGAQGREIQFRSMGLDLYGKFFITSSERFRPYVGAGLSYNRSSMKYSQNNPYFNNYGVFGSEDYDTSFVAGQLMLGSQIMITQSFGLNIEGAYSTGLGNSLSSQASRNYSTSPDQARLKDLGDEIINSHSLSILAGAVFKF